MRARCALAAGALLLAVGCGGSVDLLLDDAPDATPTDASTPPAPDASDAALDASPDAPAPLIDAAPPPTEHDGDAPTDATSPDAAPDPCAPANAVVARCASLVGTTAIAEADVVACVDAMTSVREGACFTDAQRQTFDESALRVLESALSLTQATCTLAPLQSRMQWMERYVRTARGLAQPAEGVDHAKLVRLDNAFWDGLYWGDARARAFDRSTLRAMRRDALDCARAALDAAFTPQTPAQTLPLTSAPLAGIVSEALAALGEGYDRTTFAREFACNLSDCAAVELPGAATTWQALGALDDASALSAALGPAGPAGSAPSPAAWETTLALFAAHHDAFEASVKDALGAPTYTPALLSAPSAADLPALTAMVTTRDHARALLATYAASGAYFVGPTNNLHQYTAKPDYASNAVNDLNAKIKTLDDASLTWGAAQRAFDAGTQPSYDLRPLEAARRSVAAWTLSYIAPIIRLRLPRTRARVQSEVSWLAVARDIPISFSDFAAIDDALGEIRWVLSDERTMSNTYDWRVAVSFPNPAHVPAVGESPSSWTQVDAARAKAMWDGLAVGHYVTFTLTPEDLYARGPASVLFCSDTALVVRGVGFLVEYPTTAPTPKTLYVSFEAGAVQPFITAGSELVSFTTENIDAKIGAFELGFASDPVDWNIAKPLVATGNGNGASPLATFTLDVTVLSRVLAAGGWSAPRSLTMFMKLEVGAREQGSMDWITTCRR